MSRIESTQQLLSRRGFLKVSSLVGASCLLHACGFSDEQTPLPSREYPTPTPFLPETPTLVPPSPEPSSTPDTRSYFEKYIYPALYEVALQRREEKAQEDPDYWHRVDRELNENRINFVMLGRGSERVLTDSMQIMSLDIEKNEIRVIAVPRGVSVPEISRYLEEERIYIANQAFVKGGMALTETMLEDATGLSPDFIMLVDMEFLTRAVENVFDNELEVCVPWEINDVNMGYFQAGLQNLNGEQILRLSRARYYGLNVQRNAIQQYVMKAMLRRARAEFSEGALNAAGFITSCLIFFQREQSQGNIQTSFDSRFFVNLLGELIHQIAINGSGGEASGFGMPTFLARYEFSTENNWDANNTTRRRPIGGNPTAEDLVSNYWFSSRSEIRDFLSGAIAGTGFEQEEAVCGISQ